MNKKQVFRLIAFFVVVALLVLGLQRLVLSQPDITQTEQRYRDFKNFKDGTVDVVITGTSGIDRYWIAAKAFEEYGLTAYPLSSDSQPSWLVKNVIIEAEKTQNPKLVVIDMRSFTSQYGKSLANIEAGARYLTDSKCLSHDNRMDAIDRTLEALGMIAPDKEYDRNTFVFPLVKHHGVWAGLDEFDHEDALSELGYYMCPLRTVKTTKPFEDFSSINEEVGQMHPVTHKYLLELLDYLDEQSYEVLFINTPQGRNLLETSTINAMVEILEERGYRYLIYNITEPYHMEEHFYNEGHVNYHGAEMFTEQFSQYLKEHYNFEDRREDNDCKNWYGHYDRIKQIVAEWEAEQAPEEVGEEELTEEEKKELEEKAAEEAKEQELLEAAEGMVIPPTVESSY